MEDTQTLKMLMDERNNSLMGFSSAISAYGVAAIRGAFVLNGSAAVAVLTSQGALAPEKGCIILICAIGAALAVLSAGLSFLSQWWTKETYIDYANQGIFSFQKYHVSKAFMTPRSEWKASISFYSSASLYLASVVCFIIAAFKFVNIM